jgi:hypothetical protein
MKEDNFVIKYKNKLHYVNTKQINKSHIVISENKKQLLNIGALFGKKLLIDFKKFNGFLKKNKKMIEITNIITKGNTYILMEHYYDIIKLVKSTLYSSINKHLLDKTFIEDKKTLNKEIKKLDKAFIETGIRQKDKVFYCSISNVKLQNVGDKITVKDFMKLSKSDSKKACKIILNVPYFSLSLNEKQILLPRNILLELIAIEDNKYILVAKAKKPEQFKVVKDSSIKADLYDIEGVNLSGVKKSLSVLNKGILTKKVNKKGGGIGDDDDDEVELDDVGFELDNDLDEEKLKKLKIEMDEKIIFIINTIAEDIKNHYKYIDRLCISNESFSKAIDKHPYIVSLLIDLLDKFNASLNYVNTLKDDFYKLMKQYTDTVNKDDAYINATLIFIKTIFTDIIEFSINNIITELKKCENELTVRNDHIMKTSKKDIIALMNDEEKESYKFITEQIYEEKTKATDLIKTLIIDENIKQQFCDNITQIPDESHESFYIFMIYLIRIKALLFNNRKKIETPYLIAFTIKTNKPFIILTNAFIPFINLNKKF